MPSLQPAEAAKKINTVSPKSLGVVCWRSSLLSGAHMLFGMRFMSEFCGDRPTAANSDADS
jgi:hypothetical protein